MSDPTDSESSPLTSMRGAMIASGAEAIAHAARFLPTAEVLEGSTPSHTMWKAYDSDEGVEVAMHVLPLGGYPFADDDNGSNKGSSSGSGSGGARAALERGLGADVHHPHIVRVLDAWVEATPITATSPSAAQPPAAPWRLCFITPIVSAGTLQSYVARIDDVRVRVVRKWCRQILGALDYLHSRGRVHGDVRLANVFINGETGNVLLGTLSALGMAGGVGIDGELSASPFLGSSVKVALDEARYAPPNSKPGDVCTPACDVWAFGLCVLEIATRRTAYGAYTADDAPEALAIAQQAGVLPAELADIDARVAVAEEREAAEAERGDRDRMREAAEKTADIVAMRNLIRLCLTFDRTTRPTVSALLDLDFLRERADEREKDRGNNTNTNATNTPAMVATLVPSQIPPPIALVAVTAAVAPASGAAAIVSVVPTAIMGNNNTLSPQASSDSLLLPSPLSVAAAVMIAPTFSPTPSAATASTGTATGGGGAMPAATSSARSASHTYVNTLGSHTYTITLAGAGVGTNATDALSDVHAAAASSGTMANATSTTTAATATTVTQLENVGGGGKMPIVTSSSTLTGGGGGGGGGGGAGGGGGGASVGVPSASASAASLAVRPSRRTYLPASIEPPPLLGLSFRGVHFSRAHAQVTLVLYYPLSSAPFGGATNATSTSTASAPSSPASPPLHVLQRLIRFVVSRGDNAVTAPARIAAELVVAHLAAASDLPQLLLWLGAALVPVLAVPAYVVLGADATTTELPVVVTRGGGSRAATAATAALLTSATSGGGRSRTTSNATGPAWTEGGEDDEDEENSDDDNVDDDRTAVHDDDDDDNNTNNNNHNNPNNTNDAEDDGDNSRSTSTTATDGRRGGARGRAVSEPMQPVGEGLISESRTIISGGGI